MEKGRKVRSDKKRSVAPTVEEDLYESIAQLAYICSIPIKTAGELITIYTLNSREEIEKISKHFRRQLLFENSIFMGNLDRPQYRLKFDESTDTKRLYLRHRKEVHDRLGALAYALDCTVSAANTCVLRYGTYSRKIIIPIIIRHAANSIDGRRRNQLHDLLRQMNRVNEDDSKNISLTMLVNLIVDDCIVNNKTIEQAIREYLD